MKKLEIKSDPVKPSGYLMPWDKAMEQPCFIMIEDVVFIPVFSDEEKLNTHLNFIKYNIETSIKVITDVDEFLNSVQPCRVALNPINTEQGTTRFTELLIQSI